MLSADHLFLDNQFVYYSLGKIISPMLSIPYLRVVCWVGLKPCGLSHIYFGMSSGTILVQLKFGKSCGEWVWVLTLLGDTISLQIPSCSDSLQYFYSLFCNVPWAIGTGVFCRLSTGTGSHNSAFWFIVVLGHVVVALALDEELEATKSCTESFFSRNWYLDRLSNPKWSVYICMCVCLWMYVYVLNIYIILYYICYNILYIMHTYTYIMLNVLYMCSCNNNN